MPRFARLRRLPFTTLKLDRSLVAHLAGAAGRPGDPARGPRPRPGDAPPPGGGGSGDAGAAEAARRSASTEAQGYLFGGPMPLEVLLAADAAGLAAAPAGGRIGTSRRIPLAATRRSPIVAAA